MLQMLIIGSGIHGAHLAHRLLHQTALTHDDIRADGPIAVIGAGISGSQLALHLTNKEFDLKRAACGFPVIGPSLQWHERIFVTGPLSELQIGPAARNIAGARHAGRRITTAFNKKSIPLKAI